MFNTAVVHRDMPEDFVYQFVRTVMRHRDFITTVHRAGREHVPANIVHVRLPLHRGAVRYFREQGVALADDQIPPEMKQAAAPKKPPR